MGGHHSHVGIWRAAAIEPESKRPSDEQKCFKADLQWCHPVAEMLLTLVPCCEATKCVCVGVCPFFKLLLVSLFVWPFICVFVHKASAMHPAAGLCKYTRNKEVCYECSAIYFLMDQSLRRKFTLNLKYIWLQSQHELCGNTVCAISVFVPTCGCRVKLEVAARLQNVMKAALA